MPAEKGSRHYRFEELSEGVHAAIARPDGDAICNSGIVDLGDGRLLFDTGLTPGSAADLWAHASHLLGRAPSTVANSHRHLDHFLGNCGLPKVPIWATRRTREILLETQGHLLAELTREALEKEVVEMEKYRDGARTEALRLDLEFNLRIDQALLASLHELKVVPPDQEFDARLRLPGARAAELDSLGSGHTESDAFLFLPHEKFLFAGDLVVVGVQPSMGSSDPEHWVEVLDELEKFGAERIVPGHGPVTSVEGIRETRTYLEGMVSAARASRTARLPAGLRRWEG
jgi:cyclase